MKNLSVLLEFGSDVVGASYFMSQTPDWTRILTFLSVLLHLLLVAKLIREKLHTAYPALTFYTLFSAIGILAFTLISGRSMIYRDLFLIGQPVLWVCYVMLSLELCNRVFDKFSGIASLSRKAVVGALVLALLISGLSLRVDLSMIASTSLVAYYVVIQRGIVFSLLLFQILLTLFLVWFPVPMSQNALRHARIFFFLLVTESVTHFLRNVLKGSEITSMVNIALILMGISCRLAWLFLMSAAGEKRPVITRPDIEPEEQQRLLNQLNVINATLIRSVKK